MGGRWGRVGLGADALVERGARDGAAPVKFDGDEVEAPVGLLEAVRGQVGLGRQGEARELARGQGLLGATVRGRPSKFHFTEYNSGAVPAN